MYQDDEEEPLQMAENSGDDEPEFPSDSDSGDAQKAPDSLKGKKKAPSPTPGKQDISSSSGEVEEGKLQQASSDGEKEGLPSTDQAQDKTPGSGKISDTQKQSDTQSDKDQKDSGQDSGDQEKKDNSEGGEDQQKDQQGSQQDGATEQKDQQQDQEQQPDDKKSPEEKQDSEPEQQEPGKAETQEVTPETEEQEEDDSEEDEDSEDMESEDKEEETEEEPESKDSGEKDEEESAWEEAKKAVEKADKLWKKAGQALNDLQDAINKAKEAGDKILKNRKPFNKLWNKIKASLDKIDDTLIKKATEAWKMADEKYEEAKKKAAEIDEKYIKQAREAYEAGEKAWDEIQDVLEKLKDLKLEELPDIWKEAMQAKDAILEAYKKAREAYEYYKKLLDETEEEPEESEESESEEEESPEEEESEDEDSAAEDEEEPEEGEEEEEEEEEDPFDDSSYAMAPNLTNTIILEGLSGRRGNARIIEIEDVQYRTDSACPAPVDEADAVDRRRLPILAAVRLAYLYSEKHPEWKVIVAGHTDTTASARYNFQLSALRAKSVLAVLSQNSTLWVEAVNNRNLVEDRQAELKYFHGYEGMSCDPGPIDGIEGTNTRRATRDFQAGYNRLYHENISVDGSWGPQTWTAVFKFYLRILAQSLDTDERGLLPYASRLKYLSTRQISACGESMPKDHPGADEYSSRENRRVEIIFLHPNANPIFNCCEPEGPYPDETCSPDDCPLYGNDENGEPIHIYENITEEEVGETTTVKIRILDEFHKPLDNTNYTLRHMTGSITGTTDDNGMIIEENVPTGEIQIMIQDDILVTFTDDDEAEVEAAETFGDSEEHPDEAQIPPPDPEERLNTQAEDSEEEEVQTSESDQEEEELQTSESDGEEEELQTSESGEEEEEMQAAHTEEEEPLQTAHPEEEEEPLQAAQSEDEEELQM